MAYFLARPIPHPPQKKQNPGFMSRIFALLSVVVACVLSSCFTDFYRKPLRGHEEYAGWLVEPTLYSVGETGYVKARQVKMRQQRDNCYYVLSYGELQCYHKVSDKVKAKLLKDAYLVSDKDLAQDLKTTGGGWLTKLPRAATGKSALDSKPDRRLVERRTKRAPWYRYTLSGLAFVCVDTPVNVAADAALLVSSPLWLPMAYLLARPIPAPKES